MQGAPFGFVLDSTPNDFVSGELEHAIVVVLEGEAGRAHPARGAVGPAQPVRARAAPSSSSREAPPGSSCSTPPAARTYEGLEEFGLRIPPVADEIDLIRRYGARTLAVTLNGEGMSPEALRTEQQRLGWRLGIPVVRPLEEGVGRAPAGRREFLAAEARAS